MRPTLSEEATVGKAEITPDSGPIAAMPQRIGPYRVLEKLGEGGMGEVYAAEQETPIRRKVAVKLIKPGMDSAQILARFESERQALALMNHPNIAHIFDAGTTENGRPYFVMECVNGLPLTQHCDRNRLDTRERIELFIQICEGVQHAHQKGLIHRDLKPSNVLVVLQDDRAVPKIIDFGVSKAIAQRLTERTLHTEQGQLIGTPAYMSPEQADMSGLDVDTRTDVYALGGILYELLVGAPPFDPRVLRQCGLDELRRMIREDDPLRPSSRVSALTDGGSVAAVHRKTDPATLSRRLRGDLDWIVMKAMEKVRQRRYASAAELAVDLRHHLEHRPVVAGPPSLGYRLRKFVLRHRMGVAVGIMLVVALLLGGTGTTIGLLRAERAEGEARQGIRAAEEISTFLIGLFERSRPAEGEAITAREILDEGVNRIQEELADQPLVKARLLDTMGDVYRSQGLYREAEALLKESLAIREERLAPDHLDVAVGLTKLGWLLSEIGEYEAARPPLERALAIEQETLGPDDPALVWTQSVLAIVLGQLGDREVARQLHEGALATRERILGASHPLVVASSLDSLGSLLSQDGEYGKAKPLFERALEIRRAALGPNHINVADTSNNLANVYRELEQHQRALDLYVEVLSIQERALEPGHPKLGITANNLGELYAELGRDEEAERLFNRALEIWEHGERPLSADHPFLAYPLRGLALLYTKRGEYEAARPLFERAVAIRRSKLGPEDPELLNLLADYLAFLETTGRQREAEEIREEINEPL